MIRLLLHPVLGWLAIAVLVVSFLLPVGDLGFDLCWVQRTFGLPCPGCGMTRATVALSHGRVLDALRYHVLSPLHYGLFWALAVLRFVGPARRARVEAFLRAHGGRLFRVSVVLVALWLVFGVARLVSAALGLGWLPVP